MPPPLTAEVTTDRGEMRLADALRAEVRVSGPAPLRVDPPKDWLAEASAEVWRIRLVGPPKLEDLPDGGQRWTQAFRLDPFLPGEPLALVFNPVTANGRELPLNSFSIAVRTDWKDPKPEDASPFTDIEPRSPSPPPAPANHAEFWLAGLFVAFFVLILAARKRGRRPVPPPNPEAWAARELATLEPGTAAFAEGLAAVVRGYLERRHGIPAGQRTTAELRAASAAPEPLLEVLERCDRGRYAGEPIPAAEGEALRRAVAELITSAPRPASPPG